MNSIITDDNGRYILMNAKVQGSDYILGNIYAPNKIKEQCNFFVELQQKLDDFITIQDQRITIGGDFNVIHSFFSIRIYFIRILRLKFAKS